MEHATLLGFGVATPDAKVREGLPFACGEIDRGTIPAHLRRRASQATQLAFTAATRACLAAGRNPTDLPTIFASVGGEIQVTDVLCVELAKPDGVVSPTAFHNAVHNTAAGYWSIAHGVTASATAMAAGRDSFAMALLESWCVLESTGGELLLVGYDERWPDYLAAPVGGRAFAAALVLAAGSVEGGLARLGRPRPGNDRLPMKEEWRAWMVEAPIMAAIPLLAAASAGAIAPDVALSAHWRLAVEPVHSVR
jgi:hypothetical protein